MPGRIVTELERRYGRPGNEVLEALRSAIAASGRVRPADVARVAAEARLPRAHVHAAATYYADLSAPAGPRHVRACAGTACFAATGADHPAGVAGACGTGRRGPSPRSAASATATRRRRPSSARPPRRGRPRRPARGARAGAGSAHPLSRPRPATRSRWPGLCGAGPGGLGDVAARADAGGPTPVARRVAASGLRGRGGAGFPVARKWRAVRAAPGRAPLRGGQRRRGRPRLVRGPAADGARSAPGAGGPGAGRPRLRRVPRLRLRALGVPAGARRRCAPRSPRRARPATWAGRARLGRRLRRGGRPRAPARTSPGRRRR